MFYKKYLPLIIIALFSFIFHATTFIKDKIGIYQYRVAKIEYPTSIQEIQKILANSKEKISIRGTGYSQGGQTVISDGIVIDLARFNKILSFNEKMQTITVQPGITWYEIQQFIDPKNLSIYSMQSYNDFSVGGSISVNCHARDFHSGAIASSIVSLKLMTADGSIIPLSSQENPLLFRAVVGGYGLLGIIVEATLVLSQNKVVEKAAYFMETDRYSSFFTKTILSDPEIVFHSASLWPPDFDTLTGVSWLSTSKPVTSPERLQKRYRLYPVKQVLETGLRRIPILKKLRPSFEHILGLSKERRWKNYEMSYTVTQLEPFSRLISTTFLQEYFIPIQYFNRFIAAIQDIHKKHKPNIINISIRYTPPETIPLLNYASRNCFAFVMYINIWNSNKDLEKSQIWTQELIDAAITCEGTFYLPYQLNATKTQLQKAYPSWQQFLEIKKNVDPQERFQNMFYQKYTQSF
jgi:FAD/FMN-containing dehydrogenase